jgi:receptor protein-tyrosine kinase
MAKDQKTSNKVEAHFKIYLTDFIKGIKKLWWVCIVLAVLFGSGLSVRGVLSYKPTYSVSATFVVSMQSVSGANTGLSKYSYSYDTTTAEQLASTFPHILSSNLLQEIVCTQLDVPAMPASVSADAVKGTNMFKLTAIGKDPQKTYDTLLSVIDNYPSVAKHVIGSIKMDMITSPVFPRNPSNSKEVKENFVTGSTFGLLVGVILIFVYAIFRNTIRTKDEIVTDLNNNVLGTIPRIVFKKRGKKTDTTLLITNSKISSAFSESIRVFRNVCVNTLEKDEKVVMVTSTAPSEGKTTVITNLALSVAKRRKKVLLIDADLRNPSVAALLGIDAENLNFERKTEKYEIAFLEKENLYFLRFVLDENQDGYVSTAFAKSVFDDIRDDFDYIFVDTPPCGLVSDAMFIAQAADAAIYVIYQDTVRIGKIKSTLNNLLSTDIKVLGCVLNGTIGGSSGYGYGYKNYGYGYGYKSYNYANKKYGYGEITEKKEDAEAFQ